MQYKKFCAQKGVSGLIANLTVREPLRGASVRSIYFSLAYSLKKRGTAAKICGADMACENDGYMKLDVSAFPKTDLIVDGVGNVFLKRTAVARIMGCSLPALATTYKRKGLRPLDRYIRGHKVYVLADVEKIYNRRESY